MADLQATFEISVDIRNFFNIDMFQRGFYHVVIEPADSSSVRSNLELHILKNEDTSCLIPAIVKENRAVTKTVQILHKHQEVSLDHTFLFRCHRLINSRGILESVSSQKFHFVAKLCFSNIDDEAQLQQRDFEAVSTRKIVLHVDPIEGLHAYTLLVFDYSFMAGVEMIVHASLVALHQPLLSTLMVCGPAGTSTTQTITLESILFSSTIASKQSAGTLTLQAQIEQAMDIHNTIVEILLSIYDHLKNYLTIIHQHIPKKSKYAFEFSDALTKIESMILSDVNGLSKDELLDQANMNLASACSFVLALWSHILEIVCLNRHIINKLALSYQKKRAQRFQSLFFSTDNPRFLFDEQRSALYNSIATEVRSSPYYQNLPPLSLESVENDCEAESMPIVFEDKFDVACQEVPVFKQKYNSSFSLEHNVTASVLEARRNVMSNLDKKESFKDVSKLLYKSNGSSSENIEDVSTCPTNDAKVSAVSQLNFTEEISSHTLEEPDDFPSFGSAFSYKVAAPREDVTNYSFPGYKSKTVSTTSVLSSNTVGDGEKCTLHLEPQTNDGTNRPNTLAQIPLSGVLDSSAVLTELHLTTKTVTDTSTALSQISSINELNFSTTSKICSIADKENNEKEGENSISKTGNASKGSDMLSLQAFLEEDVELSDLHDAICEPDADGCLLDSGRFAIGSKLNGNDDKLDISSYHSSSETMSSMQEMRHAAEKSKLLGHLQFPGHIYCDLPITIPLSPYMISRKAFINRYTNFTNNTHLIVLVHGLDGSSNDLRIVKTYLQLGLSSILNATGSSDSEVSFLMSVANEKDTYDDLQVMTDKLVDEILHYIRYQYTSKNEPKRISFVGHSLGGLLIRSAVTSLRLKHLSSRFYTFLSFSAPHLGTIFNSSTIVNTGLWFMQKWKKSICLRQLSCKEETNFRDTFIYKLSMKKGLEFFKNILLVASAEDRYVPYQSARLEMCKTALKDKTLGPLYQEMINNIMSSVLSKSNLNLLKYHVVHSLRTRTANTVIGRAAHIAVLDSDVFLEQFFLVTALQYFI